LNFATGCSSVNGASTCKPVYSTTSACFGPKTDFLQYSCPADNQQNQIAKVDSVTAFVKCEVCQVKLTPDADQQMGTYSGTVQWGPNQVAGVLTETDISVYKVYFVDSFGAKVGSSLGSVSKTTASYSSACCNVGLYTLALSAQAIPSGATRVMVVPVDTNGVEMPYGETDSITDVWTTTTTPAPSGGSGATPSPPTPAPPIQATRVSGDLTMDVDNVATFCAADSAGLTAVKNSVANVTQVSADQITATCATAAATRRLEDETGFLRRLASTTVDYTVTVPEGAAGGVTADTVVTAISGTTPAEWTTTVVAELQEQVAAGTLDASAVPTVSVTAISAPSKTDVTMTQTTTTSTTFGQGVADSFACRHTRVQVVQMFAAILAILIC